MGGPSRCISGGNKFRHQKMGNIDTDIFLKNVLPENRLVRIGDERNYDPNIGQALRGEIINHRRGIRYMDYCFGIHQKIYYSETNIKDNHTVHIEIVELT